MSTQWREGFAGKYALDLTPFLQRMQMRGWDEERCDQMIADLRSIEAGVIKAVRTKR